MHAHVRVHFACARAWCTSTHRARLRALQLLKFSFGKAANAMPLQSCAVHASKQSYTESSQDMTLANGWEQLAQFVWRQ